MYNCTCVLQYWSNIQTVSDIWTKTNSINSIWVRPMHHHLRKKLSTTVNIFAILTIFTCSLTYPSFWPGPLEGDVLCVEDGGDVLDGVGVDGLHHVQRLLARDLVRGGVNLNKVQVNRRRMSLEFFPPKVQYTPPPLQPSVHKRTSLLLVTTSAIR